MKTLALIAALCFPLLADAAPTTAAQAAEAHAALVSAFRAAPKFADMAEAAGTLEGSWKCLHYAHPSETRSYAPQAQTVAFRLVQGMIRDDRSMGPCLYAMDSQGDLVRVLAFNHGMVTSGRVRKGQDGGILILDSLDISEAGQASPKAYFAACKK